MSSQDAQAIEGLLKQLNDKRPQIANDFVAFDACFPRNPKNFSNYFKEFTVVSSLSQTFQVVDPLDIPGNSVEEAHYRCVYLQKFMEKIIDDKKLDLEVNKYNDDMWCNLTVSKKKL